MSGSVRHTVSVRAALLLVFVLCEMESSTTTSEEELGVVDAFVSETPLMEACVNRRPSSDLHTRRRRLTKTKVGELLWGRSRALRVRFALDL